MAKRRLTRDEQKAATRAALLGSASRVFIERGFDGASIEEISERAGYSRGAFYSNFASKEECFLELLDQRTGEHLADIAGAFARGASLTERLHNGSRVVDDHLRHEHEWCRLYLEAWTVASRHPDLGSRFADQYRVWREGVAEIIRSASSDAAPTDRVQIEVLSSALIALFEGGMLQVIIDPDALPDDYFSQAIGLLFARLLRT